MNCTCDAEKKIEKTKRQRIRNKKKFKTGNKRRNETIQIPQEDSGSTGPKTFCMPWMMEDHTKMNFQENIPGRARFQKKWRGHVGPCSRAGIRTLVLEI